MLPHFIGEDIQLQVQTQAQSVGVRADRGQCEQVLMNLVVNARDAMPHGGKLIIGLKTLQVKGEYEFGYGRNLGRGSYAVISVRDTGSGMDKETQKHIFEPFFTTKEVGKGTGLGLATVYGIVKQHKGTVWVYSEVGLGTEFKIYLPLSEQESRKECLAVASESTDGGSETILLVEDEDSLRVVIDNFLTSKGYRVLAAENGIAAMRICESNQVPIDVLLTDYIMPGLRGPEVAAEVLKLHPHARVLLMTGYADRSQGAEEDQRIHHVLQKPVSLQELAQQIRGALAGTTQHA